MNKTTIRQSCFKYASVKAITVTVHLGCTFNMLKYSGDFHWNALKRIGDTTYIRGKLQQWGGAKPWMNSRTKMRIVKSRHCLTIGHCGLEIMGEDDIRHVTAESQCWSASTGIVNELNLRIAEFYMASCSQTLEDDS